MAQPAPCCDSPGTTELGWGTGQGDVGWGTWDSEGRRQSQPWLPAQCGASWAQLASPSPLRCPCRALAAGDWDHPRILVSPSFSPLLGRACQPHRPGPWGQHRCPLQPSLGCLLKPGPGESCPAKPRLTQVVHVPTTQSSLPQSEGTREMPQGQPETRPSHWYLPVPSINPGFSHSSLPSALPSHPRGAHCWDAGQLCPPVPGWHRSPGRRTPCPMGRD